MRLWRYFVAFYDAAIQYLTWRFYLLAVSLGLLVYYLNSIGYTEKFLLNRYTAITRRVNIPKNKAPKMFAPSISFMGGGQLWMFSIG